MRRNTMAFIMKESVMLIKLLCHSPSLYTETTSKH